MLTMNDMLRWRKVILPHARDVFSHYREKVIDSSSTLHLKKMNIDLGSIVKRVNFHWDMELIRDRPVPASHVLTLSVI